MATKVYWITLRTVSERLKDYIQRNQLALQANLTTAQYNCVVAVLEAVIACLGSLPKNTPSP